MVVLRPTPDYILVLHRIRKFGKTRDQIHFEKTRYTGTTTSKRSVKS